MNFNESNRQRPISSTKQQMPWLMQSKQRKFHHAFIDENSHDGEKDDVEDELKEYDMDHYDDEPEPDQGITSP
jgi:hypothetical protein